MIASGELPRALVTSLTSFALGFGLAVVVGLALGFAMGWWRSVGRLLNPYVSALYVVPMVALVPLIIIWLGFGLAARVLVIFLFCVFEILLNAYGGIRALDSLLVDVARTFGAGRAQVIRRVVLPGSLPFVFVGLRIGVSRAIKGMILAEMMFAIVGLGGLVQVSRDRYDASGILAVVAVVSLLGVMMAALVQLLERRVLRWRPAPFVSSIDSRASRAPLGAALSDPHSTD
jgi:ABC-type nitrate/sulfonate/bicarbonate transport system permease component